VAVRHGSQAPDNPAINANNPPGGVKRKRNWLSRKSLKGKANNVPESIAETLGRNNKPSLAAWHQVRKNRNICPEEFGGFTMLIILN
jgi:hypothetical protein